MIDSAKVELVTTILLLFVWILGVASFAGPVMTLVSSFVSTVLLFSFGVESFHVSHYLPTTKQVVEPIERMVRLLSMLMKDPLGYQNSQQYRKLKQEDDEAAALSMWPKDALKGK